MAYLTEVVAGWTGGLAFTLKADGSAVNLTGCTVSAVLRDCNGTAVDTTGDVTVTGTTSGQVTYTPDAADFSTSGQPFRLRFKVVDQTSAITYYPNDEASLIAVHGA